MTHPAIPPLIDDIKARLLAQFEVNAPTLTEMAMVLGEELSAAQQRQLAILVMAETGLSQDLAATQKAHARLLRLMYGPPRDPVTTIRRIHRFSVGTKLVVIAVLLICYIALLV